MFSKYQVKKVPIKVNKELNYYVPLQTRKEALVSPFYKFESNEMTPRNNSRSQSENVSPFNKKPKYSLMRSKQFKPMEQSINETLSQESDQEECLHSEEFREMRLNNEKRGRRKAILKEYQFGLQVEDLFQGKLSSLTKSINEDQRDPRKTAFHFNHVRSGLLDEMNQVKNMIQRHQRFQSENAERSYEQKDEQIKKLKLIKLQSTSKEKSHQNSYHTLNQSRKNEKLHIEGCSPRLKTNMNKIELIVPFRDESDYEFILKRNLNKCVVNQKKRLREVFILKNQFKNNSSSITVEKFYVPVYYQIIDNLELVSDFLAWKDQLSIWMKLQGKLTDNVYTSFGFPIANLHQIPPSENILILQEEDGALQFWQEFQSNHGLQLSTESQRNFIQFINSLDNKEDIYKTFTNPSYIQKIINGVSFDKPSLQNEKVAQIQQDRNNNLNNSLERTTTNHLNDKSYQYYSQDKSLNISSFTTSHNLKGISSSTIALPNLNNQDQSVSPFNQNSSIYTRKHSYSTYTQVALPNINRDRLQLIDLFSQYQSVMINNATKKIQNPSSSSSIAQGALQKSYNGVKMKIIQQNFPYLAKKTINTLKTLHASSKQNIVSES